MITIPVWVFVILVILAGIMGLLILLAIFGIIITIFSFSPEYDVPSCPNDIERDEIPNSDESPVHRED